MTTLIPKYVYIYNELCWWAWNDNRPLTMCSEGSAQTFQMKSLVGVNMSSIYNEIGHCISAAPGNLPHHLYRSTHPTGFSNSQSFRWMHLASSRNSYNRYRLHIVMMLSATRLQLQRRRHHLKCESTVAGWYVDDLQTWSHRKNKQTHDFFWRSD